MILGIGADICGVQSFARTMSRYPNYPQQFCNDTELAALAKSYDALGDAIRIFSLKEAVGKAFGTGLTEQFWFDDIHVEFQSNGRIEVSIDSDALEMLAARFAVADVSLTVSCEANGEVITSFCLVASCS